VGRVRDSWGRALPTIGGSRLDKREAWIQQNAASLRQTLAHPAVRTELLALLGSDDADRRRERRREEARRDLEALAIRWTQLEEGCQP